MLNLHLNIEPETEKRLKTIFNYMDDQEKFAQNIITWQIMELQKSVLNIRLDIKQFESRYNMKTEDFYHLFEHGKTEDTEDFIIWPGLYEMLYKNELLLKGLV